MFDAILPNSNLNFDTRIDVDIVGTHLFVNPAPVNRFQEFP